MCGIAGKLYFDESREVHPAQIRAMTDAIAHRGPDDEGVYTWRNVGLGNRRLAIIDLSAAGHMPMTDDDENFCITFNGEIYNFQTLRNQLEKEGVRFRSQSDTEVILNLYKKYGTECIQHLRGMFAFAIWDRRKEVLFLAHDRLGKKPLKYYYDDASFIFASELKAILKNPEVRREVDWSAVDEYMTYKYVPHPKTGFKNIWKLEPGHYMLVGKKGVIEKKRYWNLDFSKKQSYSETEWQQRTLEVIRESVQIRLVSDVPLGAHLSGGVDSGMVVALMAEAMSAPVKTFSIGFKEKQYDELPFARAIAHRYNTDHHELIVEPQSLEDVIPRLAYQYEEPYGDSSALPSWYLAEMTRSHVTVALNGDGGDENFAGYNRYLAMNILGSLKKLPLSPVAPLLSSLSTLGYRATSWKPLQKAQRFWSMYPKAPLDFFLEMVSHFVPDDKDRIYSDALKEKIGDSRWKSFLQSIYNGTTGSQSLDRFLATDIQSSLVDDLLVKVDIASMAHSLEVRSPFLDHTLLELTAQMPASLKIRGLEKKYLLKKIAESFLPRECIYRKKQGFSAPLDYWFRGTLTSYVRDQLLDERFLEVGFDRAGIETLIHQHTRRSHNHDSKLWSMLLLKQWLQTFFS